MKILSISADRRLFQPVSEVRQRMIEYGGLFDEFHIIVFSLRKHCLKKGRISSNVWIYPTNSLSRFFYIFNALKIGKKIIQNSKFQILNSAITCQDPFESGLVGVRLKKKFKIPLQVQIHTDFMNPYFKEESFLNRFRILLAKFIIPKAKCIRVVSDRIKNSLSDVKCQMSDVSVLPIFIDVEEIKNTPVKINLHVRYPQFEKIILMASRLTKEKNIGLALKAFLDIIKTYPKTGLVVVGSGPEEENLKLKAKNYGLGANVVFEPSVVFDDLISYYKTCDLFLLTSNYEGYGRTLIEAAVAGCKIISSDVGITSELLPENNIFAVSDDGDLKNKLLSSLKGKLEPAKNPALKTKKEYLEDYKMSFEKCFY